MAISYRPYLSLKSISIDRALACQLPRGLAYYYLALPLAKDDGGISVMMARPEDRTAVGVLESVLGLPVVPVRGRASEIRSALDAVWQGSRAPEPSRVLYWGYSGPAPELASLISEAFSAQITWLDARQNGLHTALTVTREGRYRLTAIDAAPPKEELSRLLRESATPVLLARGGVVSLRHVLVVLRGHSPDESALDWIIPLSHATGASVTLLAVAPPVLPFYTRETRMLQGLPVLLSPDSAVGEHILSCARRLNEAGITGTLRIRQGHPDCQIADEIAQGDYNLIAIAAEAHGDFVQQVLHEVDNRLPDAGQPVLVIKPNVL